MREEYPESGELVLGTVDNIFKQGAFITLDEYSAKKGMLHLSEISLKWVRNIRDYVKEGQKVVLIVLRVDPEKGHIDLSLRRVTDAQRKNKLQEVKQKQRANKLLEVLANDLKADKLKLTEKISSEIQKNHESVFKGLEAIAADNGAADALQIEDKWRKKLVELVNKSIKSPNVEITGYVELRSYEPDGIDIIKKSLGEIFGHAPTECKLTLSYVSAPYYRISIIAPNYKKAEKALETSTTQGIKYMESRKGEGVFHRELEQKKT